MTPAGDEIAAPGCPPAQALDDTVREIGAIFPGWHVWHSSWSDTWNGHREGEKPYFGGSRRFMVSACDAPSLVALLERQDRAVTGTETPGLLDRASGPRDGNAHDRRNADGGTAAGQRQDEPRA
jgi:hypothetical protein